MTIEETKHRPLAGFLFAMAAPLPFAVAIAGVVLLPLGTAFPIGAAFYAIIALGEARSGVCSPQSLSLGAYFGGGAVVAWMFPEQAAALGRYAGAGGFATVFLLALGSVVCDRPLHGLPAEAWEPRRLRWAKTGIWLALCPPAMAVALVAAPGAWAAGAQLALAALAAAAAAIMDFGYCGSLYRRRRQFTLGGFSFREIERDEATLSRFLNCYADEISAAVGRDRRAKVRYSRSEIFAEACRTELASTARRLYFHAYDGDKIVGGVAVALDGPDGRLPMEKSLGVSFDPLRRHGRVMEVRRLSVNGDYRFHQDIIRGLFKCAIEVALENDVSFMVDHAFHFVVTLLGKVGFGVLHVGGREAFEFGSPLRLVAHNFVAVQFANPLEGKSRQSLRFAVNQCLRYRYRQRAVIRQAWFPARRRGRYLSISDIDSLCVPGESQRAAHEDIRQPEMARP
jgi:hypothetical protein